MRVLIVSEEQDLHACVMRERLAALGAETTIWNTSWFPWKASIDWTPDGAKVTFGDKTELVQAFEVIWWRRFGAPTASPLISDRAVKRFVKSEAVEAMRGLFLGHPCVVNDITAEQRATAKLPQLTLAKSLGLQIPKTLVSNDASRIRTFAASTGPCIVKTLYCDYPHGVPTRPLTEADLDNDRGLEMAPIIVQERISCDRDIRVSVVADEVFAGELVRPDGDEEVDWRKAPNGWQPHTLPTALAQQLRRLIAEMGLSSGAVDLRLNCEGAYVFFEVNPSGQFLFLEIDAGLPVSDAMARMLIAHGQAAARAKTVAAAE